MTATFRRFAVAQAALGSLLLFALSVPLQASDGEVSQARIVRLSFVEGTVTLQRPGATDWASAPVNTPIQQGFQLSTDKDSFAEVQFENGSTVRVGELSLMTFDELGLNESGGTLNRLSLDRGYATVDVKPEKTDLFEVHHGGATVSPQGHAEFRIDTEDIRMRVEVFRGSLEVSGPTGSATLARNETLTIAPGTSDPFVLGQGITADAWDQWVSQRDLQTQAGGVAPPSAEVGSSAPAYGWSDLNQYGTWTYLDNCGMGWVPNAASSWAPFSFGQWSYYPGFGYTWIGYEPWGWLPYHYGGWTRDATLGWAWCPGTSWGYSAAVVDWYAGEGWIGWAPHRPILNHGGGGIHPRPPHGCHGCMVTVGTETFQKAKPIDSHTIVKAGGDGHAVPSPDIPPSVLHLLPGRPVHLSPTQQALVSKEPNQKESPFEHDFRSAPAAAAWAHHAPETTFASPPSGVRGGEANYWSNGGGSVHSTYGFAASGGRSGGSSSPGGSSHSGGGLGGSSHSSGGFGGGSHSGGSSGGGSASSGGGGHSGGGGSSGGGGGGHH